MGTVRPRQLPDLDSPTGPVDTRVAVVAIALGFIVAGGSLIPARRAISIDPVRAIAAE
jgi:ABC-type lipoprotein release transport system permease subunit